MSLSYFQEDGFEQKYPSFFNITIRQLLQWNQIKPSEETNLLTKWIDKVVVYWIQYNALKYVGIKQLMG